MHKMDGDEDGEVLPIPPQPPQFSTCSAAAGSVEWANYWATQAREAVAYNNRINEYGVEMLKWMKKQEEQRNKAEAAELEILSRAAQDLNQNHLLDNTESICDAHCQTNSEMLETVQSNFPRVITKTPPVQCLSEGTQTPFSIADTIPLLEVPSLETMITAATLDTEDEGRNVEQLNSYPHLDTVGANDLKINRNADQSMGIVKSTAVDAENIVEKDEEEHFGLEGTFLLSQFSQESSTKTNDEWRFSSVVTKIVKSIGNLLAKFHDGFTDTKQYRDRSVKVLYESKSSKTCNIKKGNSVKTGATNKKETIRRNSACALRASSAGGRYCMNLVEKVKPLLQISNTNQEYHPSQDDFIMKNSQQTKQKSYKEIHADNKQHDKSRRKKSKPEKLHENPSPKEDSKEKHDLVGIKESVHKNVPTNYIKSTSKFESKFAIVERSSTSARAKIQLESIKSNEADESNGSIVLRGTTYSLLGFSFKRVPTSEGTQLIFDENGFDEGSFRVAPRVSHQAEISSFVLVQAARNGCVEELNINLPPSAICHAISVEKVSKRFLRISIPLEHQ